MDGSSLHSSATWRTPHWKTDTSARPAAGCVCQGGRCWGHGHEGRLIPLRRDSYARMVKSSDEAISLITSHPQLRRVYISGDICLSSPSEPNAGKSTVCHPSYDTGIPIPSELWSCPKNSHVGNATALIEEPGQDPHQLCARDRLELASKVRIREVAHGSITVVIADDHPVILGGLVTLLSDKSDFKVIAACGDGAAALEAILRYSPDVALLDLRMPKMTGLDVLSHVSNDNTRIVILTAFAEDHDLLAAISRGAHGIILKDSGTSALITCLRKVVLGYRILPPELVKREQHWQAEANSVHYSLTSREREVMGLVAIGLSNKAIAQQLGISAGTVKLHLHHIYCKTAASSRSALMTLALRLWPNSVKCKGVM